MPKKSFAAAFDELLFQRIVNSNSRINLSSGNPSYAPFKKAVEASSNASHKSNVQLYATGAGYKNERMGVLPFCESQGIQNASVDNIVFGLGITHLYYSALSVLHRKFQKELNGKKPVILMSSPSYGLFTLQPEMFGYAIETFPLSQEDGWEPRPEIIERRIKEINQSGDKQVVIAYNINPHNPTGSVTKPETTQKMANLFAQLNVFVLDDMAYYGLEYTGQPTPLAAYKFENSLSLYSCSKAFALPRLRAGFACGPSWLTTEMYDHISAQMISLPSTTAPLIKACFGEEDKAEAMAYIETNKQGYKFSFNIARAFFHGIDAFQLSGAEQDAVVKSIREGVGNKKIRKEFLNKVFPILK